MAMCGDFPRVHRKAAATQIAGFERVACTYSILPANRPDSVPG